LFVRVVEGTLPEKKKERRNPRGKEKGKKKGKRTGKRKEKENKEKETGGVGKQNSLDEEIAQFEEISTGGPVTMYYRCHKYEHLGKAHHMNAVVRHLKLNNDPIRLLGIMDARHAPLLPFAEALVPEFWKSTSDSIKYFAKLLFVQIPQSFPAVMNIFDYVDSM
jgi:hypothetical protein